MVMKKARIKGRLQQHVVVAVLGVGAVCGPAGAAEGGVGVYLRGTFGRQTGHSTTPGGSGAAGFQYDRAAMTGLKPWTSENFRNNPDNFQFAVVGDRTARASSTGPWISSICSSRSS
jgi:hypothetical protein